MSVYEDHGIGFEFTFRTDATLADAVAWVSERLGDPDFETWQIIRSGYAGESAFMYPQFNVEGGMIVIYDQDVGFEARMQFS